MMRRRYIQSLATLQLLVILVGVATHFWLRDVAFLQGVCASFYFVYSGYFTALNHPGDRPYGLRDHVRYMHNKLAKLYPLHVLALALCLLATYLYWNNNLLFSKVTLAHLTLLSTWIPTPSYYFGINPVAWFICDLFFLFLISPLLIRPLRKISLGWQVLVVVVLIVAEMVLCYDRGPESTSLFPGGAHYFMYEFPPVRILDFSAGIVLCHASQSRWWRDMASRLTASRATLVEVGAMLLFLAFYWLCKTVLHPHWYRGFCSVAPAVVTLMATYVLTSGKGGALSRLLSAPWLASLSVLGAEVYLLQFGVYALVNYVVGRLGLPTHGIVFFIIQTVSLLLSALAVHHGFVMPLYRWLKRRQEKASA